MMRDFEKDSTESTSPSSEHYTCKENVKKCNDILDERFSKLRKLRDTCSRRKDYQNVSRRMLRNLFYFGMYARRWAGPGTPYAVATRETNRNVGQHKAISEELEGMTVYVSDLGEVTLRDQEDDDTEEELATFIQDGKAMSMMNAYLLACFNTIDNLKDSQMQQFIRSHMLSAVEFVATDGTYWPAEREVWDVLFGCESSVANAEYCIRQYSSTVLHSCKLLAPFSTKPNPSG